MTSQPFPDPASEPQGSWAPPAAGDIVTPTGHPTGPPARTPWVTRREVRAGVLLVAALVVVGALAGLVWLWWSPPRGIALALGQHSLLPDETEAFIAADGRYAVITAVIGFAAGLACWWWRSVRGPALAVALAVGSGAGAAVTALVGRLFGGGATGATTQKIVTPPLELRAVGLIALQAAVALVVYGVSVTVSARDDLGVDGAADARERAPAGAGTEPPPPA